MSKQSQPEKALCGYTWTGTYNLQARCNLPRGHQPGHRGSIINTEAYWRAVAAKFGEAKAAEHKEAWLKRQAKESAPTPSSQ